MKRLRPTLPIALLLLFSSSLQASETVHVVLLGGQSNMVGVANYDDLSDEDKKRVNAVSARVQISRDGRSAASLSYVNSKGDAKKRFGPELFIGVTLAEANPKQEYLFIKTARGGTSLYGAWNPDWSAKKAMEVEKGTEKQTKKYYNLHLAAIRDNLEKLERKNRPYRIIGMAWMQGENDAAREVSARRYEANLKKLIAGYRRELDIHDLPFVCVQINSVYGDFPAGPKMVRKAFVNVAEADPKVEVIRTMAERPATDFPKVDGTHYNAEGQKRLGIAMAKALLGMQ